MRAIAASSLTHVEKHVLIAIEMHADNLTGWAYPSIHTLMLDTSLSRSAVEQAILDLRGPHADQGRKKKGRDRPCWIEYRPCASKYRTNLFRVRPPGLDLAAFGIPAAGEEDPLKAMARARGEPLDTAAE